MIYKPSIFIKNGKSKRFYIYIHPILIFFFQKLYQSKLIFYLCIIFNIPQMEFSFEKDIIIEYYSKELYKTVYS